jgi:hypothetical protein
MFEVALVSTVPNAQGCEFPECSKVLERCCEYLVTSDGFGSTIVNDDESLQVWCPRDAFAEGGERCHSLVREVESSI